MPFTVMQIEEIKPQIDNLKNTDKFDILVVLLVVIALFVFRGFASFIFKVIGFLIIAFALYGLLL
jgi:large-conductance mechanosensitive channel